MFTSFIYRDVEFIEPDGRKVTGVQAYEIIDALVVCTGLYASGDKVIERSIAFAEAEKADNIISKLISATNELSETYHPHGQ